MRPAFHIRVDGHLLAREGIESEARGDFGGPNRAMGHDQKLDGDQGEKEDKADDVVSADDELPEGFDDGTGGACSVVSVEEDAPAGGDVEAEPEEREQEQKGRKDGEIDCFAYLDGGEKDNHRRRDGGCEEQVEQKGRDRDEHDEDHADGDQGEQDRLQALPIPGALSRGNCRFEVHRSPPKVLSTRNISLSITRGPGAERASRARCSRSFSSRTFFSTCCL